MSPKEQSLESFIEATLRDAHEARLAVLTKDFEENLPKMIEAKKGKLEKALLDDEAPTVSRKRGAGKGGSRKSFGGEPEHVQNKIRADIVTAGKSKEKQKALITKVQSEYGFKLRQTTIDDTLLAAKSE